MYGNYKYIVKISNLTASKASSGTKPVAAAPLILLSSSKGSSAPPAQTPVTANSSGLCRAPTNIPTTEMGIMGPNPSLKAGNL